MSNITIHQISREEVDRLLNSSYSSFLSEVTEYVRITADKNMRDKSDYVYKVSAREIIYQQCLKQFRYSNYVTDAYGALNKVASGSYGDWIRRKIRNSPKMRAEREKAEAKRIADLKEKCKKLGLDFEKENKKYLKKKRSKARGKAFSRWIGVGAMGIIMPPLLLVAIIGFFMDLFKYRD